MKFLCLGYLNERKFDAIPAPEKSTILEQCFAQCIPFRETGKVVEELGLLSSGTAKSIRPRKGRKPSVTDGPFIETKEQLGAVFIVEADTMEEAVEIASLHPTALMGEEFGFGIEIRPVR